MRRFLRDVILRSAAKIRDAERARIETHGSGRPSTCMFCDDRPRMQIADQEGQAVFVCYAHLGPFVQDWTVAPELVLVRL